MENAHYTFMDIISLNSNNWDKAYEMMTLRLSEGKLMKVHRGVENIIYIPQNGLRDQDLIYDQFFTGKVI